MLAWKKSITLKTSQCLDVALLHLIKRVGFDGVDVEYEPGFFDDKAWMDKVYKIKENLKSDRRA